MIDHTGTPGPMERPSALYSIHNHRVAAGLEALLYSGAQKIDELSEYLSLNRVILGNGGFCLLLAKVGNMTDQAAGSVPDANGLFADLLEEQLVEQAIYYMLPVRGLVLCIVAMPNYTPGSRRLVVANQMLMDGGNAAREQLLIRAGTDALVAVSPICAGLHEVPGTFQHTLDLLAFHSFFGRASGLCDSTVEMPKRRIRLSSEFQERCMSALNLLIAGQQSEFIQNIMDYLEQIKSLVPESLQQYKTLCYQFMDRLCCDLVDHHLGDTGVLERTDLFWLVHEPSDFPELRRRVEQLLMQLMAGGSRQRQWNGKNVEAMKAYIQLHHKEINLTVSAAAAEFGMAQPVFSAFFKRNTGASPLEYMTKLRIQTALELLRTTQQPLPEIAYQSGFGSVSTMHRVFKKATGMTPSKVRSG